MKRLVRHFMLAILLMPLSIAAQEWDGISVQAPQTDGSTYTITSGAELAWIAQQSATNSFEGKTIVLANDIDLGEQHNWTPIGGNGIDFQGTFDGQFHTVKRFNILYALRLTDIGFFGAIGQNGTVRNFAIESGKIFVAEVNNVGSIAGRNEGLISHCFSMLPIVANESNNVGGLAGLNNGTIDYSYQAGYISDAGNNAGGLTGLNNGSVTNCYCSGYTLTSGANSGSVTGVNKGTFTNTYFDQQMCLQKASTQDEEGVTAVTQTNEMYAIFRSDNQWVTTEQWYPQLKGFASTSTEASITSVLPIWLPINEAPIQRAETITKNFLLCTDSNAVWSSPDINVIEISRANAIVTRQCSKRTIVLTVTVGNSRRGVLLQVVGFNVFDPGVIGGFQRACHGDNIKFSDKQKGAEILDAVGGRDDDKKKFPYTYLIEQYQLIDHDGDGIDEDTVLFQTYTLSSNSYPNWHCDTWHDGHWLYRRYVHDSQCQLDFVQSMGEFYLNVFSYFDAGEVETKTDTIYGNYPAEVHIGSAQDAEGGEGPYLYRWHYTHININYLTGDTTLTADSTRMKEAPETSEIDTILTHTGEYFFYRTARDLYCNRDDYAASRGVRHFVVFDSLKAGRINDDIIDICADGQLPIINETEQPTGGNGIYSYQWLINNQVIEGADKPTFEPDSFDIELSPGRTYIFTRQVKDNTGLMDWIQSEGSVTVNIYRTLVTGSIRNDNQAVCLTSDAISFTIDTRTQQSASGDGTLNYRWQIYNLEDSTYKHLKTLNINKPELKDDTITLSVALPANIRLQRQVQNPICSDAWQYSEGEILISIDSNRHTFHDIILCRENMPYNGTHTFTSGETKTYRFDADGDVVSLNGHSFSGCSETAQLTCHITDVPEAEVQPIGVICQTDTLIYIKYTVTGGNPNYYHITYNAAAYEAGFTDIDAPLTDPEHIIIPIGAVPLGEFEMYLQFIEQGQALGGCQSKIDTLDFSVNLGGFVHQKWNDVLYIDNNDKNGFPDAESDLLFSGYQWYKDGELIEGATGQVYNEQGGLNGVYYALLTDTAGRQYKTCPVEVRPTSLADNQNTLAICPNTISAGGQIRVNAPTDGELQIISLTGKQLTTNKTSADHSTTLAAPQTAGLYIVRLITTDGKTYYNYLIVE